MIKNNLKELYKDIFNNNFLRLQIPANEANSSQNYGALLGQAGININNFCAVFNNKTFFFKKGILLNIIIYYDNLSLGGNKSFTITIKNINKKDILYITNKFITYNKNIFDIYQNFNKIKIKQRYINLNIFFNFDFIIYNKIINNFIINNEIKIEKNIIEVFLINKIYQLTYNFLSIIFFNFEKNTNLTTYINHYNCVINILLTNCKYFKFIFNLYKYINTYKLILICTQININSNLHIFHRRNLNKYIKLLFFNNSSIFSYSK
jgi:hypothetical protein